MVTFTQLDEDGLIQWILRRLGAPLLKVELTEEHIRDEIEWARRWFAAKKGYKRFVVLNVEASKNEYDLPADADVVTDVVTSYDPLDLSLLAFPYWLPSENNQIPYSVMGVAGRSGGLYSNYVQVMQYIEQAKRVLSQEADWRQENRKLQLFPIPMRPGTAFVEYTSHTIVIHEMSERDFDLIKRFALAKAKEDFGRIRSKFDSYATAQGSVTMDGATLLEEARAELEVLEEEIAASAGPMGFICG
jgi:hypothetical protein